MALSRTAESNLIDILRGYISSNCNMVNNTSSSIGLIEGGVFSHYLEFDIDQNTMYLPNIFRNYYTKYRSEYSLELRRSASKAYKQNMLKLDDNLRIMKAQGEGYYVEQCLTREYKKYSEMADSILLGHKFIFPLTHWNEIRVGTSTSIINKVREESPDHRLIKVILGNTYYYCMEGMYLDHNMKPLIVFTEKCTQEPGYINPIISNSTVFVSPSIFSKKDLFSKHIIKDIIPFILNSEQTVELLIQDYPYIYQAAPYGVDDTKEGMQFAINSLIQMNVESIIE